MIMIMMMVMVMVMRKTIFGTSLNELENWISIFFLFILIQSHISFFECKMCEYIGFWLMMVDGWWLMVNLTIYHTIFDAIIYSWLSLKFFFCFLHFFFSLNLDLINNNNNNKINRNFFFKRFPHTHTQITQRSIQVRKDDDNDRFISYTEQTEKI